MEFLSAITFPDPGICAIENQIGRFATHCHSLHKSLRSFILARKTSRTFIYTSYSCLVHMSHVLDFPNTALQSWRLALVYNVASTGTVFKILAVVIISFSSQESFFREIYKWNLCFKMIFVLLKRFSFNSFRAVYKKSSIGECFHGSYQTSN